MIMGCVSDKVARYSGPKIGPRHSVVKVMGVVITKAEKAMIRDTWHVLKLHVANVGVIMFTR